MSELVVKDIDLKKIFCIRIITKPIPNSTADKTKKKNVNDKKLTLSYRNPMDKDNKYRVIHKISAVRSKCNAVFTFIIIVVNIRKKSTEKRLISPMYTS